jgi:hypothetical protein
MQTRQQYEEEAQAWINGLAFQNNGQLAAEWMLPTPEELFLTAEEMQAARPNVAWMTIEEQMAHLALDPRQ